MLDGEFLDEAKVKVLADLPPKEVLQATLLGVLNQPAQMLVRVLNEHWFGFGTGSRSEAGAGLIRLGERKKIYEQFKDQDNKSEVLKNQRKTINRVPCRSLGTAT